MAKRPHHSTVVAYLALFFAMTGTAAAATGGTFLLGRSNSATTTTTLADTRAVPLSLSTGSSHAPLAVSNSVKVSRLNADLLDGLDSTSLQHRVEGTCPQGMAMTGVTSAGSVSCALLAPPPNPPAPSQGQSKGWAIFQLQLSQDAAGNWQAVARLQNNNATAQDASWTVTVFNAGTIVGTLIGSATAVNPGDVVTVQFVSQDAYGSGAHDQVAFQTDTTFNS